MWTSFQPLMREVNPTSLYCIFTLLWRQWRIDCPIWLKFSNVGFEACGVMMKNQDWSFHSILGCTRKGWRKRGAQKRWCQNPKDMILPPNSILWNLPELFYCDWLSSRVGRIQKSLLSKTCHIIQSWHPLISALQSRTIAPGPTTCPGIWLETTVVMISSQKGNWSSLMSKQTPKFE